jgi:hypothetical protein
MIYPGRPARPREGLCVTTMQTYPSPQLNARSFATAPYGLGDLAPPAPLVQPWSCLGADGDWGDCAIRVHHRRERKTGPGFALVVLYCRTHRHAFTLYPLGHVPYGRLALAPVSCDGELLHSAEAHGACERGPCWQSTIFLAALQAASGHPWPRDSDGIQMIWDTQLVHLATCAKALGLSKDTSPRLGEQLAQRLDVPRLELLDAAQAYRGARGYPEQGRAIESVLERLRPGRCLLEQLLCCGVLTGLWSRVERWEPGAARARRTVFCESGTLRT